MSHLQEKRNVDPVLLDPDPDKSPHHSNSDATPNSPPAREGPSMGPSATVLLSSPATPRQQSRPLGEISGHVTETSSSQLTTDNTDTDMEFTTGNPTGSPVTSYSSAATNPSANVTLPHVASANQGRIYSTTACQKLNTKKDFASRGGFRISEKYLEIVTSGLDQDTKDVINERILNFFAEREDYPEFVFEITPDCSKPFDYDTGYKSFRFRLILSIFVSIRKLLSEEASLKAEINHVIAETTRFNDFDLESTTATVALWDQKLSEIIAWLDEYENDHIDETIDRNSDPEWVDKEKASADVEKRLLAEKKLLTDFQTLQNLQKHSPQREQKLLNVQYQLSQKLEDFKVFTGTVLELSGALNGFLAYDDKAFERMYKTYLKPALVDTLTKEELEEYSSSYPQNYERDIRILLKNEPIHVLTFEEEDFDRIITKDNDAIEKAIADWYESEKSATLKLNHYEENPHPILSVALFRTHCKDLPLNQVRFHFDDPSIPRIHKLTPARYFPNSSELYMIVAFSYKGKAPKRFNRTSKYTNDAQLIVIAQTESVCQYCRTPGHDIKDCLKRCRHCKQKHYSRDPCSTVVCHSCNIKHLGHKCSKSWKKAKGNQQGAQTPPPQNNAQRGKKRDSMGSPQPTQAALTTSPGQFPTLGSNLNGNSNKPLQATAVRSLSAKPPSTDEDGFVLPKKTARPVSPSQTAGRIPVSNGFLVLSVEEVVDANNDDVDDDGDDNMGAEDASQSTNAVTNGQQPSQVDEEDDLYSGVDADAAYEKSLEPNFHTPTTTQPMNDSPTYDATLTAMAASEENPSHGY